MQVLYLILTLLVQASNQFSRSPVLPHIILLPDASRVVLLGGLDLVAFEGVL